MTVHEQLNQSDIMIVDDTPANLNLLASLLKDAGYAVRATSSPDLALQSALSHPPALLLLDVRMPGMDGFEVCRRLKQDFRTRGVPVIFVSGQSDVTDRVHGFEAGGADFISKPFQREEVLARVHTHLALRQAQEKLEQRVSERTAELENSLNELRETMLAMDLVEIGICRFLLDTKQIIFSNDYFAEVHGYQSGEICGLSMSDLSNELMRNTTQIQEDINAGGWGRFETIHRHKDGHEFPVELTLCLHNLSSESGSYCVGFMRDISERKAVENERKEFEEKILKDGEQQATLRKLLETTLADNTIESILGSCLEQLLEMSWLSVLPKGGVFISDENGQRLRLVVSRNLTPEVQSMCAEVPYGYCLCGRAAASGKVQFASHTDERHEIDYEGMQDHGHYCLPLVAGEKILGVMVLYLPAGATPEPEKERFLGSVANILSGCISRKAGERALIEHQEHLDDIVRQRTAELKTSETRTRAIVTTMLDGVVHIDIHGIMISVNPAVQEMFGYTEGEMVGRNVAMLMPEPIASEHDGYLLRYLETRHPYVLGHRREVMGRRMDGSLFPIELACNEMTDDAGSTYIGVIRDITKRKAGEQKLKEAMQTAQDAAEAKSNFLANMSHEIRTPMNGVIGMVDVLQQTELNPAQQRMLDTIQNSSLALLDILNDILDFSKIEAGKLEVEHVPTLLRDVVEGTVSLMTTLARAGSVELHTFVSPRLPRWVASDPKRLRQVLFNLIGNAVKFTSGAEGGRIGKVELRIEPAMLADGRPAMQLRVIDNGIGMSQETLARLFRPFTQADESTSRKFGGTGLGLCITQRMVGLMGGQISVRSTPGEGSEFTVDLPLEQAAPGQQMMPDPDLTGVRVLAVTGDAACAEIVASYCGAAGAEVAIVSDLAAARAQLQRVQSSPGTTILLMGADVKTGNGHDLPETMGTVQLVRHKQSPPAGAIPVQAYPLLYHELIHGVAMAAGRLNASSSAVPAQQPKPLTCTVDEAVAAGRLILLAEDNETNREVMLEQLRLLGYSAETAEDGAVALDMWRTGRYALLLTDCHMPNMDGFELTETIRNEEAPNARRPIVAVTANAMYGEAERCIERGMDDYLSKPLRMDELGAMLAKWLPLPEKTAAKTAAKDRDDKHGSQGFAAPDLPVWDATALTRMVGDNPAMHRRLLEKFMVNAQKQVAAIFSAAESGDPATVGSVAHALKSAARTVGAMQFGELCQEMEMAGKAGDGEKCRVLAGRLNVAFDAAAEKINRSLN